MAKFTVTGSVQNAANAPVKYKVRVEAAIGTTPVTLISGGESAEFTVPAFALQELPAGGLRDIVALAYAGQAVGVKVLLDRVDPQPQLGIRMFQAGFGVPPSPMAGVVDGFDFTPSLTILPGGGWTIDAQGVTLKVNVSHKANAPATYNFNGNVISDPGLGGTPTILATVNRSFGVSASLARERPNVTLQTFLFPWTNIPIAGSVLYASATLNRISPNSGTGQPEPMNNLATINSPPLTMPLSTLTESFTVSLGGGTFAHSRRATPGRRGGVRIVL